MRCAQIDVYQNLVKNERKLTSDMGGVPKRHHTSSKVGRRRSHHAIKPVAIFTCEYCNAPKLPHRACKNCGAYGSKKSR